MAFYEARFRILIFRVASQNVRFKILGKAYLILAASTVCIITNVKPINNKHK